MNTIRPEKLHYDPTVECRAGSVTGDFFPDFLNLENNVINRGRVFSVLVERTGMGVQQRWMGCDSAAWAKCVEKACFRECYEMSMAKLALSQALLNCK